MQSRHGNDRPPPEDVVVHASRWGLFTTWSAGPSLLVVALLGFAFGDGFVGPSLLVLGGLALLAIAAWDYPHRVEFTADGIVRVCALRRHVLAWDELVAIERGGRRRRPPRRSLPSQRTPTEVPVARGGLVARGTGRRRWQLTDRLEGHAQHAELRRLVQWYAEATQLRAPVPPVTRTATRPWGWRRGA